MNYVYLVVCVVVMLALVVRMYQSLQGMKIAGNDSNLAGVVYCIFWVLCEVQALNFCSEVARGLWEKL